MINHHVAGADAWSRRLNCTRRAVQAWRRSHEETCGPTRSEADERVQRAQVGSSCPPAVRLIVSRRFKVEACDSNWMGSRLIAPGRRKIVADVPKLSDASNMCWCSSQERHPKAKTRFSMYVIAAASSTAETRGGSKSTCARWADGSRHISEFIFFPKASIRQRQVQV